MANWAKGLAAGFESGVRLGDVLEQRQIREGLAKAYGLTPQEQLAREATPEELQRAQAEALALQQRDIAEFGLTPQEAQQYAPAMPTQGARVAMPTYTLGGQTFNRAPTQEEIDDARMRAAADVYGQFGDAAKREELLRGLRQEQRSRAQEARSAAGFETQQELAGLQIKRGKREESEATNYANFSRFAAENPGLAPAQLRQAAREQFGLTPDQEEKYILGRLNIQKADADAFKLRVQEKLRGKNLSQVGQIYNTDPDFDDKTDLALVPGKNGSVTVNFIDKTSGQITSSQGFKNEALALEYLTKQAVDPLNIGTWLQTVQKNEAAIAASNANAQRDAAYAGALGQGLKSSNLIDVKRPDGSVTQVDRSKYMVDGELRLPKGYSLVRAEQQAAQIPPALKTRYDELIKSDRWERARTVDEKILLLEKEGIPASVAGLRSPTDDLIALMRQNPQGTNPAQPGARTTPQTATPAGQQLLGLAGALLPPAPIPTPAPATSAERMRGLYLGQQR